MKFPENFVPDAHGYVRHWLMAGPVSQAYAGPPGADDELRKAAIDPTIIDAPTDAALGAPGPFGTTWRYHDPGHNVFIECSAFWHQLETVDAFAATELHADEQATVGAWLWASGVADLWLNGRHIARVDSPRYMYPQRQRIELLLQQGANHLAVRLQVLGLRDTRFLFGLQLLDHADRLAVRLPGDLMITAALLAAERFLNTVRADGREALVAAAPAPANTTVCCDDRIINWPAGQTRLPIGPAAKAVIAVSWRDQKLTRLLELPINGRFARALTDDVAALRREHLLAASKTNHGHFESLTILCARAAGTDLEGATDTIARTCDWIDGRPDCADFALAALLRLVAGHMAGDRERQRIADTARRFRYWSDETGSDAMCFGSENHSLLFYGCQLVAGRLWPDERFAASGRLGHEQAAIGLQRCIAWLDRALAHGFHEYHSSGYMPITTAALMNLVDFSGDESISRRAAALVDTIFYLTADHAFAGVTIAPQGRVYRGVLTPEIGGTQAMLSYATPAAIVSHTDWLGFVASSPTYRPPDDVADRMARPVSRRYRQHCTDLVLHKTADYLLTSAHIPGADTPVQPTYANNRRELAAGLTGYQQHLWQATLGVGCHVFVNHPGEWIDGGSARPGYWYGNGTIPRTEQRANLLMQMYSIADDHPVPFTHAHWPTDAFDESASEGRWHFGRRGDGMVGLWCSEATEAHDQTLTGRELRAYGRQSAWLCVCGSRDEQGDLASFIERCRRLAPDFDRQTMVLRLADRTELAWR